MKNRSATSVTLAMSERPDGWCRTTFRSAAAVPAVVERVAGAMTLAGFEACDVFDVRVVLEEALANALGHGRQGGAPGRVRVLYHVTPEGARFKVRDEGPGFDPSAVPDPTVPECLESSRGRGLLLMQRCATWLRFNRRGNQVAFGKRPRRCRPHA